MEEASEVVLGSAAEVEVMMMMEGEWEDPPVERSLCRHCCFGFRACNYDRSDIDTEAVKMTNRERDRGDNDMKAFDE